LFESIYVDGKFVGGTRTFYIYCTVCYSLVFLHDNGGINDNSADDHLSKCIKKENSVCLSEPILRAIAKREYRISSFKRQILEEEAEIQ
jgi:hypothetical protein